MNMSKSLQTVRFPAYITFIKVISSIFHTGRWDPWCFDWNRTWGYLNAQKRRYCTHSNQLSNLHLPKQQQVHWIISGKLNPSIWYIQGFRWLSAWEIKTDVNAIEPSSNGVFPDILSSHETLMKDEITRPFSSSFKCN